MANQVSLLRVVLAMYAVYLLYQTSPSQYISAFLLTIIIIALDGLDGFVARQLKEESKLGAVIDILADRIVEYMFWIVFAALGWFAAWVPILVVIRGTLTDGIRSLALTKGFTAFGKDTMAQNPVAKFITASRFSRVVYAVAKALAFVLLIIVHIPNMEYWNPMTVDDFVKWLNFLPMFTKIAYGCAYVALTMCVLRGLPVLFEGKRFLDEE